MRLIGILLAALLVSACASTHEVRYSETNPDGTRIETYVFESVPPGGKKLSEGATHAGVKADGAWDLTINGKADTDAQGTAQFYENLGQIAFQAIAAYLAAQTAAPVVPAITGE